MGIVGIIGTIIVGFVVGLLARFFYPGAVNLGFWMTTLLGIGGSVVGGLIAGLLFKSGDGKFTPAGWIMSIIGAMLLIWAYLTFGR
ncbi:MAG: GlsB/YeaQ/YmgE family stress response membrane protein [Betaproteobacteria bacterium]|jgi:uncharacterized membrane protein YeaQ/YmgE (transglycosylase-associated protein family)|nr:GlsB/YeaQ/YmgE family stress response membrane protein [Betaproteobacteria bacterium]MBK7079900.1 GlsB/YeaQ/YmgE family stress response membrane protein [Betaproteobacteria bacterium]MBK7592905.1 GlsB/YeaQ/YmgE family stress response membrane protein [Betaproteobacteria bacterium]MBK7794656.1 GlsB/YeaQ/YmgE family stress response membrane protein [Betaproteobacteria bacterium]MBK8688530.1 GlsB/YeaQ/YmgE family stress response membrane protein [Betaproteobacteria bacterium]